MKPLGVALALFLAPLGVYSQPGLIDQPQTFPWTVGTTPSGLEEAGALPAGGFRFQSSVLWFNTFRQAGWGDTMTQQIDMEALLTTVSARWAPAPNWELRAQGQGWAVGGGVLDGFLSGFHGSFQLPNQGRERTGSGHYRDFLSGRFDTSQPSVGLTQVSAGVRLVQGPWSWSAWLKPPLPAPIDWGWTDRWTAGSGLGWGDAWFPFDGSWRVGAGVGLFGLWLEREPSFDGPSGGLAGQLGFYTTVEPPWGGWRALAQGNWSSAPLKGPAYLAQGPGLLTIGVQLPVGRGFTAELAVTEEFLTWATNEVGFQVGFLWQPSPPGQVP